MLATYAILAAEPPQLLPARTQMAWTLGVHIVLVPMGVAFTFLTLVANWRGLRRDDAEALRLAQRWSKVAAVLFAVGAVTGTVLSFELGLLWPRLMGRFGEAFGLPFMIEGLFFFIEAVFIAIYIYGWKRMRPWTHFWAGVPIVIAGIGGTLSVVAANAWMNDPGGFSVRGGKIVDVDPVDVIFNGAFWHESIHMLLAAYLVAGFLVASVYASAMRRGRTNRYHRLGFMIPFTVAAIVMPLQFVSGDLSARWVRDNQPVKFAAMELVPETARDVPEIIGGYYADGKVKGPRISIPGVASLLSGFSIDTEIQGFNSVPEDERPPVSIVHLAWNVMIGLGSALLGLAVWFAVLRWRRRDVADARWFLRGASVAGIASVVAMWAGWTVTEVGRQPWVVQGLLRTEDAVTRADADGLWVSLGLVVVLYVAIATATVLVLRGMARRWRRADEGEIAEELVPYGPARTMLVDEAGDSAP